MHMRAVVGCRLRSAEGPATDTHTREGPEGRERRHKLPCSTGDLPPRRVAAAACTAQFANKNISRIDHAIALPSRYQPQTRWSATPRDEQRAVECDGRRGHEPPPFFFRRPAEDGDGLPLRHIHRRHGGFVAPTRRRQRPTGPWPSPCFATTCRWRLILSTSHMAPLRPCCSLLTPDGPAQCRLTCQQEYTCIIMFPLRPYLASRSANGPYPPPRKSIRLAGGFPFAGDSATGDTGRYMTP
jgi:hypothetical protein